MCGIIGYVGSWEAGPLLLEGLQRLEYHGYPVDDIAVLEAGDNVKLVMKEGRVEKTRFT